MLILCCLVANRNYAQTDTVKRALPDSQQVMTGKNLLPGVVVTGRKNALTLLPDKKVFEVGKDILSQNGSASDVLNGLPSVSVSPQGQVLLRGNPGVTVLINGRRSGLTQGNMLEQLQAAQIERIEVITSPSARYDAAGATGIINIILKKNHKAGFNGQVQITAGFPNDTRFNPSLNYQSDRFNFFSTLGIRKSDYRGLYASEQVTPAYTLAMDQKENRHDDGKMLYTGMDYRLTDKQTMTLAYLWNGTHDHDKTWLDYHYYHEVTDSIRQREGESWEHRNYNQLEYNYTRLFNQSGRKWTVDVQYDWWNSRKNWQLFTGKIYPERVAYPAMRTNNDNASHDLLLQTDWVQPLGTSSRLEAGIKTEARNVRYDFLAEQQQDSGYKVYDGMNSGIRYREHIQGAYLQGNHKRGKWNYLAGIRLEYTAIGLRGAGEVYEEHKNYLRVFPSLHIDYSVNEITTLQVHYSSRISRPALAQLSPFAELTDITSRYTGNPQLNPSYTSLCELGLLRRSGKFTVNPTLFYQHTMSPFAEYTWRNAHGVFITMPVNISGESRVGLELTMQYSAVSALQLSMDGNLFYFRQSGQYDGFDFAYNGFNCSGRISAQVKLPYGIGMQVRCNARGTDPAAQSVTRSLYWVDMGLNKKLWSDRLSLVADATNILDTRRYYTRMEKKDYLLNTMSRFNGARLRVSVVYKLTKEAAVRQAKTGNRS
ncbi:Outer membrane receptor proteins, mostly Fe transport [Filimonas lacunae]|uniref:Outer membrane receptor proteins, mostly Fe transport n=1 Tax=Filimonas lacunae TaxID=477680 RepID=A0A173MHN3_9BACT|nr:outer membrane beta-barrel protein [Filimonas lacunae]BAV06987.1 TonB-dependent receptor [Filimonas lacunae]SIS96824.1 Outer membrane receptor proteins, mostly Fe transport [Filimonas lacunae]